MSIPEIRSLDLLAFSNYEAPGECWARGIDLIGELWPDFGCSDDDVSLADYLTGDFDLARVLTGESERMSWLAHPVLLPFAFDLPPWSEERRYPSWWVRLQYAEVIDAIRLEVYRNGTLRRMVHVGPDEPWVLVGQPFSWEQELWEGLDVRHGEPGRPGDRSGSEADELDLSELLTVEGTYAAGEEGSLVGRTEFREGRAFWRPVRSSARADALVDRIPGSFLDDHGLAHLDLDAASVARWPGATQAAPDGEESWLDVEELCARALKNLLGVGSLAALRQDDWVGLEMRSQHLAP